MDVVPDEAQRAAQKAVDEYRAEVRRNFPPPGPMIERAMHAAAPHIARAAQVQILRELLTLDRYDVHTREDVESWVQHRIYELEQS
jgi:hypothetical protein